MCILEEIRKYCGICYCFVYKKFQYLHIVTTVGKTLRLGLFCDDSLTDPTGNYLPAFICRIIHISGRRWNSHCESVSEVVVVVCSEWGSHYCGVEFAKCKYNCTHNPVQIYIKRWRASITAVLRTKFHSCGDGRNTKWVWEGNRRSWVNNIREKRRTIVNIVICVFETYRMNLLQVLGSWLL